MDDGGVGELSYKVCVIRTLTDNVITNALRREADALPLHQNRQPA